jgi:hypothetical protein
VFWRAWKIDTKSSTLLANSSAVMVRVRLKFCVSAPIAAPRIVNRRKLGSTSPMRPSDC